MHSSMFKMQRRGKFEYWIRRAPSQMNLRCFLISNLEMQNQHSFGVSHAVTV